MLISRFVPIIAPIAFAGSLAAKKPTPITVGTLRTDSITFGFVLLGTILLVGALLFLPVAASGRSRSTLDRCPSEVRTGADIIRERCRFAERKATKRGGFYKQLRS